MTSVGSASDLGYPLYGWNGGKDPEGIKFAEDVCSIPGDESKNGSISFRAGDGSRKFTHLEITVGGEFCFFFHYGYRYLYEFQPGTP